MRATLAAVAVVIACGGTASVAPDAGDASASADDASSSACAPASDVGFAFECASSCSPETVYNSPGPGNLAANATHVYFTEPGSGGDGRVMRIATDAPIGSAPEVIATGLARPDDIAIDAERVYWTNSGSASDAGSVMAMPLGGGAAVTLASGGHPKSLALDACNAYWSGDDEITTVPIAGGSARVLGKPYNSAVECIAVDAKSVYVLESYGLDTIALGGGAVAHHPYPQGNSIVVAGGRAYLTSDAPDPCGAGWVGPIDGPNLATTHGYAVSLAVDRAHLWWLDWGECGGVPGTVARVALGGGAAETIVAPPATDGGAQPGGSGSRHSIVVTPAAVFWIEGNALRRLR